MTALGDVGTNTSLNPGLNAKLIRHVTGEVDSDDTFTIDLGDYGCTNIHGIMGYVQTTAGSIAVKEQPTTAVADGVLTVTVKGSSVDDKVRTYLIWAY